MPLHVVQLDISWIYLQSFRQKAICRLLSTEKWDNKGNNQWRSQNEVKEAMAPRNKLAKSFTGILYQFPTATKTSVTDNIID